MSQRMYRGQEPFTREQRRFVVEAVLAAAWDRIEGELPLGPDDRPEWDKHFASGRFEAELRRVLETAGMSLAIFFAQLGGTGVEIMEALAVCDFEGMVKTAVQQRLAHPEHDGLDASRLRLAAEQVVAHFEQG